MNKCIITLYIAQGRPGSDEPSFALIFSLRSFVHLLSIEEVYLINYQVPLRIVIEDEFIGAFRDSLLAHRKSLQYFQIFHIFKFIFNYTVDYANNKADYFARRLYSTIAGSGTDEKALNRQILSRCEIDLENIKNEYEKIFLTSLRNAVAVLIYNNYSLYNLKLIYLLRRTTLLALTRKPFWFLLTKMGFE